MTLHLRAKGRHLPYGITQCTCYPTQVNIPRLNSSQRPVLDLPTPGDGRLSWHRWPVMSDRDDI